VTALRVLIAGGGTGGHLYPGIAVARELLRRRPDAHATFVGTARGLEARVVPAGGFELDVIRSAGLKGKSADARIRGLLLLPGSFVDAWRVISRRRPAVVVGVGGYSSGPVVLVAALRHIPTMVLEQNAVPGLTNRTLARWVRAAAVSFDETLSWFRGRGFVTGNPVRPEFFDDASTREDAGGRERRVLVLGGSQGAHAINVAMVDAMTRLSTTHPDVRVLHQTGPRDLDTVRPAYAAWPATRAEAYIDDVAGEMHAADLVVSRAGATTLAELAAAGCPAVLVPFAAATDDHQRRNAGVLVDAGAAEMLEERRLTGESLAELIGRLLNDPARLQAMGRAMRGLARPDAAARIVDRLLELAGPAGSAGRQVLRP
jgi:UDP-N-acetylglucosamine--N-acetylmuramyl-(pentapeptide) pyrophosphoryl-undecaprenol N-acetylglucosamine transferase